MYEVIFSRKAQKKLRNLKKSGRFNFSELEKLIDIFGTGNILPTLYHDHALSGAFSRYRECHLEYDLLVLYERIVEEKIIVIFDIGTHNQLFGR